jgi:hypothetical protein
MIDLAVPITTARALSRQGFAVFPVRGKQPLTPHGVYSASRNISQFSWHDADGVGIATGEASGVDVLDVDIRLSHVGRENPLDGMGGVGARDGLATLATLGTLPETRAASTPSGGRHYWFRHVEGSRNRTKLAPGLEWFSNGKLVVVPPAPGRHWICEAEIAEAPDWLRALVLTSPHHALRRDFPGPLLTAQGSVTGAGSVSVVPKPIYLLIIRGTRGASAHTQRRVRGLWANLAAKASHRNDGLNFTAWEFSKFIDAGDLDHEIATKLLWLACEANGYLKKDGAEVVREIIRRVLQPEERSN